MNTIYVIFGDSLVTPNSISQHILSLLTVNIIELRIHLSKLNLPIITAFFSSAAVSNKWTELIKKRSE